MRVFVAVAVIVIACSSQARATSCVEWHSFLSPSDGAVGVPTDTRIWIGSLEIWFAVRDMSESVRDELTVQGWRNDDIRRWPETYTEGTISLQDQQGERIAATVTVVRNTFPGRYIAVLSPHQPLQPKTRYRVLAFGTRVTEFETGAGPLKAPPPTVPKVTKEVTWSMGYMPLLGMNLESGLDLQVDASPFLLVHDQGGKAALDPVALDGLVSRFGRENNVRSGGICNGSWHGAVPGARTSYRYGVFDLSGRFSGWSEAAMVRVPLLACAFVPSGKLGGVALEWWLLLMLAVRSRWVRYRRAHAGAAPPARP